jgi:hypothetical protein
LDIDGDAWTIWFGDKGSENFYKGMFSKDGDTVTGGYRSTAFRVKEANSP